MEMPAIHVFKELSNAELSKIIGGAVEDIAINLKMLRVTKGISQSELAQVINVEPAEISMYEHGKRVPSPTVMINLSDYYGVSIDSIMRH